METSGLQPGLLKPTILDADASPWWVSKEVCDILGIVNSRSSLSLLDHDQKASVHIMDISSSSRKTVPVTIINEFGLYSMILRSRKLETRAFARWVTHEVLPTIRRSGISLYLSKSIPKAVYRCNQ